MLRLSPDMLSATCELLEWIKKEYIERTEDTAYSQEICHLLIEEVLKIAITCGLVISCDSKLRISDKAEAVIAARKCGLDMRAYQIILYWYIINIMPSWAGRIPYGRQEACLFMSRDEYASFKEAGLLSEAPKIEEVQWWDSVALKIKGEIDTRKIEIGRIGERATLIYERERTGKEPIWKSIDTNCAGFDIQSIQSNEDTTPRLIEVKTTIGGIKDAWFHISSNEWNVAKTCKHYYFYLWNFEDNGTSLAIITPESLNNDIPRDGDNGKSESTKIPFSTYEKAFNTLGGNYENY